MPQGNFRRDSGLLNKGRSKRGRIWENSALEWVIPNGPTVVFHKSHYQEVSRDTIKNLVLSYSGKTNSFEFAKTHAGYDNVELRYDVNTKDSWIIDRDSRDQRTLGCLYNWEKGAFVDVDNELSGARHARLDRTTLAIVHRRGR